MTMTTDDNESITALLARRDYVRAVPLLRRDVEKYPANPRIRLQFADALSGAGVEEEAIAQYEATAAFYEEHGLVVQAIAVRKKAERLRNRAPATERTPSFPAPLPRSPLFEDLSDEERRALVDELELEQFEEGDMVIVEGQPGSSLYVIASGEVKVYTRTPDGESVYLARLSEGDFFGEVSVLTGKPRTATITASQRSEMLRLDREKLDAVIARHPRIRGVLEDFYEKRASHTVEAMIDSLRQRRG